MLIYGRSKWKLQRSETLLSEKCQVCNSIGSIDVQVYSKYVHVFWIPFCPLPKEVLSVCGHCKQALTAKQMPPYIKESADELKKQVKTPFYYWAGAAGLSLLLISVFSSIAADNKRTKTFAASPQVNDVYSIKLGHDRYTLYKISQLASDTVFFAVNQYESTQESGLTKPEMVSAESYIAIDTPLSKKELNNMLAKGDILKISRK